MCEGLQREDKGVSMMEYVYSISSDIIEIIAITMPYYLFFQSDLMKNKIEIVLFYALSVVCVCFDYLVLGARLPNVYLMCLIFLFLLGMKRFWKNLLYFLIIIMIETLFCGYTLTVLYLLSGVAFEANARNSMTLLATIVFPVCQIILWGICKVRKLDIHQFLLTTQQKIALIIALFSNAFIIGLFNKFMQKERFSYELFLSILFYFLFFVLFFYVFVFLQARSSWKNEQLRQEQMRYETVTRAQESYLNFVIKRDDELRKFRHDIRAHMIIMKDLVEQDKNEEVLKYIEDVEMLSQRNHMQHTSGCTTIDAVVNELFDRMESRHIQFTMDGCLQNLSEELSFEVSICIYNLLLNAIEACEKMENPDKQIDLVLKQYQQKSYICVKNSCENMEDAEDIKDLKTTKEDCENHGFGSRNVKEIAQKHKGKVVYSVKDNRFICELIL